MTQTDVTPPSESTFGKVAAGSNDRSSSGRPIRRSSEAGRSDSRWPRSSRSWEHGPRGAARPRRPRPHRQALRLRRERHPHPRQPPAPRPLEPPRRVARLTPARCVHPRSCPGRTLPCPPLRHPHRRLRHPPLRHPPLPRLRSRSASPPAAAGASRTGRPAGRRERRRAPPFENRIWQSICWQSARRASRAAPTRSPTPPAGPAPWNGSSIHVSPCGSEERCGPASSMWPRRT